MALQKRSEHFQGNALGTADGDVRMKRLEIRVETCTQDGILNTPMQRKEMGMSLSHAYPNHRWPFSRPEEAQTAQGQVKREHPNLAQRLSQAFLRSDLNVAEKAEGQMKLLLRKPAQTADMRIECKKH
jgi:hypothetical protein